MPECASVLSPEGGCGSREPWRRLRGLTRRLRPSGLERPTLGSRVKGEDTRAAEESKRQAGFGISLYLAGASGRVVYARHAASPSCGRCRQGPPLQSRRPRRSCPLLPIRRQAPRVRMLKPSRSSVSSRLTAASMFFSAASVSRAIGAAVGRLAGGVAAYHRAGPRGRPAR
jgi:hypothetical protein